MWREGSVERRLDEVEKLLDEVLLIRQRNFGKKHRDVGMALIGKGIVAFNRGDRVGAVTLLQSASQALDNEDVAGTLLLYLRGHMARKGGRLVEAVPLYLMALDQSRTILGESHPLYLMLLGDYAGLQIQNGDAIAAEAAIKKAHQLAGRSILRWHPLRLSATIEYADFLHNCGRSKEAVALYNEALEIAERLQDPAAELIKTKLLNAEKSPEIESQNE